MRKAKLIAHETYQGKHKTEEAVCGIVYNGETYYFRKNLQGDIIAITDENGTEVGSYTYDAWGVCTEIAPNEDSVVYDNPFRYRGYYYDVDTELYYLQSRYYDPTTGRFINADDAESVIDLKICTQNLFGYCQNNPVNNRDFSGKIGWDTVFKFIMYALLGIVGQLASDIIENLYQKIIKKSKGQILWSPAGDYIGSAISFGMCAFDLFNRKLLCFIAPFIPVAIKYITNLISGASISWQNILVDLMAAFVAGIIAVFLNRTLKNKLSKIRQGSGNNYAVYARYINKKSNIKISINKWFLKISFAIVISTTVLQLLVNLLFKKG